MNEPVKRYNLRQNMPATATTFLPDVVVSATDYARLEQECERLRSSAEGLKDTMAGAKAWMEDVTNFVLYPLAMDGKDKIALEAEGFGSCTPDLFNSIDAALSAKP